MSKLYSKPFHKQILVIVESPAKCKKIEEYLGPQYKCLASFGHLRELPSLESIDFYQPTYKIIDQPLKKKQIITLRNAINESCEVILATDDDREGEAIAWHLCQLFDLSVERTKRIVFHEITESAVKRAVQNPRAIDMHLVEAQQCRQILDLMVGFKVSPILWKHISRNAENSLSAGRCQTPALKLIYDNQQEIEKNPPIQIYQINGYFTSKNLPFELNTTIENKDNIVTDFLNDSIDFSHMYSCSTPSKGYKSPPEPFTTSRLQQVASNELHYSPKETMKLCQTLYEAGHITYMRTDSKVYSEPFLNSVKVYVLKEYGEKYFFLNQEKEDSTNSGKIGKKDEKNLAQEAHEAIRPTHIETKNFGEESNLGAKERKMYQLIWRNTVESCMSPATYFSVTASITAPKIQGIDKPCKYTYSCEKIDFLGWKIVVKKPATNDYFQYLQTLAISGISYSKIVAKTSLKNQLLHYTEARLVQLLEEKGIGRPSTFSTLIDKIQERGYVKKQDVIGKSILCKDYELSAKDKEIYEIEVTKEFGNEKNKLVVQPIGIIVLEFLMTHFNELFNYDYTRSMESDLDQISKGLKVRDEVCRECDLILESKIVSLKQEKQDKKMEYQIDDTHFYIIGKYGPVIKKVETSNSNTKGKKPNISFLPLNPEIKIDLHKLEKREYQLEDLIVCQREKNKDEKVGNDDSIGEFEGHPVFIKKGKFGLYLCYGEKGKTTKSLSNLGNRPLESISWEEVKPILEQEKTGTEVNVNGGLVRKLTNTISIRKSKKGEDYLFFKTEKMKRPQFFDIKKFEQEFKEMDYKTCDLEFLLQWIKDKYSIF